MTEFSGPAGTNLGRDLLHEREARHVRRRVLDVYQCVRKNVLYENGIVILEFRVNLADVGFRRDYDQRETHPVRERVLALYRRVHKKV